MGMITGRCFNCEWYEPNENPKKIDEGTCHGAMPEPAVFEKPPNDKKKYVVVWPEVIANGWCSGHRQLEPRKVPR